MGWPPNVVEKGDVVLVWGAAGGLGSLALQIVREAGGRPVAVVSDASKRQFCMDHGAVGVINRNDFSHWGRMPDTASPAYGEWLKGVRAFGKAIWDVVGERVSPRIVFEHPGESTLPTSCFVCATGGMIVICAGTTGYNVTMDLRYHWMRQKRFQGSHLSNDEQAAAITALVDEGRLDQCSRTRQRNGAGSGRIIDYIRAEQHERCPTCPDHLKVSLPPILNNVCPKSLASQQFRGLNDEVNA